MRDWYKQCKILIIDNPQMVLKRMIPDQQWSLPQFSGRFLRMVGQNPSDSKSNWLHVDIFWFFYIQLRYIL